MVFEDFYGGLFDFVRIPSQKLHLNLTNRCRDFLDPNYTPVQPDKEKVTRRMALSYSVVNHRVHSSDSFRVESDANLR